MRAAFESRGSYDAAVKAYGRAISLMEKKKSEAIFDLGVLSIHEAVRTHNAALLKSAIDYLRYAIRLDPENFNAKKNLMIAELLLRESKEKQNSDGKGKDKARGEEQEGDKSMEKEEQQKGDLGKEFGDKRDGPGRVAYEPHSP